MTISSNKCILMIDRNFMVDRRIVLEAKLLRQAGCRVALCASYGPIGLNEREISGLPVLRFNDNPLATYGSHPTYSSFEDIATHRSFEDIATHRSFEDQAEDNLSSLRDEARDNLSRHRFDRVYQRCYGLFGRYVGFALSAWFGPRYAIKRIAASHLPISLKLASATFLSLLTFQFAALWHLPGLVRQSITFRSLMEQRKRMAEMRFALTREKVKSLPGPTNSWQRIYRMFRYPRYGLACLMNEPGTFLAGITRIILSLLTFDSYVYNNIISFARRRSPFVSEIPPELKGLPQDIIDVFREDPLDYWEKAVLAFGLNLDRIDIVHVHDLPALRVGVLISQRRGIPLVYDAHELYSYQPFVLGERKKRLFDLEHRLIKYCSEVVVINSDQAEVMKRDHGYDRFTALTNATELPENFDVTKRYTYIHDHLGLPPDTKTMLFMGAISRGRNIHLLLEGVRNSKYPVHIVLLTWGLEIIEFRTIVAELGLNERVHFVDPVPWHEIVFWAASADVGVMPYQARDLNTRISSPNKMYEFIAAGTPMIGSSELVNVQRVVGTEGFGVLVPLHEASDYTKAIDEIFDPAKGGPERFRPALIRKRHKYLWDTEARAFQLMYERLLKQVDIAVEPIKELRSA